MSWLVETLLKERYRIRNTPDIESDEYNNLLIIEDKIKELYEAGVIDDFELALLDFMSTNKSYSSLEEILGINRKTIAVHFKRICDRISYSLGGIFTDDGYLNYMREEYNLDDDQILVLVEHINGKYRHTVRS